MVFPGQLTNLYRYNLDEIENNIDAQVKKNHGSYPWEEAILDQEYETDIRDELAKRYIKAGWAYVYHHTSSENGERPGLTCFILSTKPVEHIEKDNKYHKFKQITKWNRDKNGTRIEGSMEYAYQKYGQPKNPK